MSSITLHGASLYFGLVPEPLRAVAKALGQAPAARSPVHERLLDLAAGYELSQPSYAADLRASATSAH